MRVQNNISDVFTRISDENSAPAGIVGPMPKPKKYMDPRTHSASVAEMARQMAQRRKEVGLSAINIKI